MNINMTQLAPYIWIVGAVLVVIVAFVIIRFFWHHILKFVVQGCLVVVGILILVAVLHFLKVF